MRTREVILHLWWNSRLRERQFLRLFSEARAITKERISASAIRSGEPGRREAMPYFLSVLRELIRDRASAGRPQ